MSSEKAPSPEALAQAVLAVYNRCLRAVVESLKGLPAADQVRPRLLQLKEEAIEALVPLGYQRRAMGADEQRAVDLALRLGFHSVDRELFQHYARAQGHYIARDHAMHLLLAEFNVITQYADHALLAQQNPAEAERLGLSAN